MQNGIGPKDHRILPPRLTKKNGMGYYWFFGSAGSCQSLPGPTAGESKPETHREKLRRLEAVLFLSPQGIASRRAAKVAGLADATEVRTLIRELNQFYDSQLKAYRIEEVAGGYAIWTRARLAPWLRKLSYIPGDLHLGRSALETLAIVAYRQPILRAEIEAIRGVGTSEVLKQLMEMDLVRISGRSEDLGRPYLYGTTQRFLQMFGLRSADRLPRIEWVTLSAPLENIPSSNDLATESEIKESTVRKAINAMKFMSEEIVDERLLDTTTTMLPISAIDDDEDADFFDDEDEEDDAEDDEEIEEWDDEEEESDESDEEDELEEDIEESEEEEEEWEEVDDETEPLDEEEDDDEDDWDDDEDDDDWDDDDDDDWE
jgi:segregation and condensation protein B